MQRKRTEKGARQEETKSVSRRAEPEDNTILLQQKRGTGG